MDGLDGKAILPVQQKTQMEESTYRLPSKVSGELDILAKSDDHLCHQGIKLSTDTL
jgi:hypothetical protein